MAYEDTYLGRAKRLISEPRKEAVRVIPFLKSRLTPYYRRALETIGIYGLSKPYKNHNALLHFISSKNGFFVQCGANDGYGNDPTYYLEKAFGWKGIMVEPLPIYKACQKNRRASTVYNFATGSFEDRDKTVTFVDCYGMSFIKGSIENEKEWIEAGERTQGIKAKTIEVPLRPVQDIIDGHFAQHGVRKIDLLVADVEGYELSVLRGFDIAKNKPTWILLEIQTDARLREIQDLLAKNDYTLAAELEERDYLFTQKKLKHDR